MVVPSDAHDGENEAVRSENRRAFLRRLWCVLVARLIEVNRTLSEALELEQYAEEGSVANVTAKAQRAWELENDILAWKANNSVQTKKFRDQVTNGLLFRTFPALGFGCINADSCN